MITFTTPQPFPAEYVARNFSAYLLGDLAFKNGDLHLGPFEEGGSWQLELGNNWWIRQLDEKIYRLSWRYDNQEFSDIGEALFALFSARHARCERHA